jgi:hypothetical protein
MHLGSSLGEALGTRPVFLFDGEQIRSDSQHANKVAWAADGSYAGPIRIRGGRVDGHTGAILFGGYDNNWKGRPLKTVDGDGLYPELDLLVSHSSFPNSPPGWRIWPTGVYVATPGCYALQVDGVGFTELIIFHSFDLRTLPAGSACPVSRQQVAHGLSQQFGSGPVVGSGTVFALIGDMDHGALHYSENRRTSNWAEWKVLWLAEPKVRGMLSIRGHQIDAANFGPNWITFDPDALELQWQIKQHDGWSSLPSITRVQSPGCYSYQIDSEKGSETIVFQVVS